MHHYDTRVYFTSIQPCRKSLIQIGVRLYVDNWYSIIFISKALLLKVIKEDQAPSIFILSLSFLAI